MATNGSKKQPKRDTGEFTVVSKKRVAECLATFSQRIENRRQKESPYYSFPSDKTRIRVLEYNMG
ncbi:hypothetical protein ACFLU3_04250 [Chloroflexota bacterium]